MKPTTQQRKALRNNPTEPEKRVWAKIRASQLGFKFRRQHPIQQFIVDFYCPDRRLVVELDGESHFTEVAQSYDTRRDEVLRQQGCIVVRYLNSDVMNNLDGVLEDLQRRLFALESRTSEE